MYNAVAAKAAFILSVTEQILSACCLSVSHSLHAGYTVINQLTVTVF